MDFGFGILFFVKGSDLAEDMRRPLRLGVDFDYFILLVIGDISLSLSLSPSQPVQLQCWKRCLFARQFQFSTGGCFAKATSPQIQYGISLLATDDGESIKARETNVSRSRSDVPAPAWKGLARWFFHEYNSG